MQKNEHEVNYRTDAIFKKMQNANIFVCGAGALGSNLINNLVRQGFKNISVIDMDRVESSNIATQIYTVKNVGQKKADAIKSIMYQNTKTMIEGINKELRANNAKKFFKNRDLVVDVFDNWESRGIEYTCEQLNVPCVHAGMSDDGFAEIKWNDIYKIPDIEVKQDDICDYPLAANLVHVTSAILAEIVVQFISSNSCNNREITLKDIKIHSV